jgi:hypothetical protein
VEKSIKKMNDKMATVDDDVLNMLGEQDLKIMTQVMNNIHETAIFICSQIKSHKK